VKFETTPAFDADVARLKKHRGRFADWVREDFIPACSTHQANGTFPASLRVKSVQGAPGVLEVTWSFSGPDGRATFEFVTIDGEQGIRWRRVGDHSIFKTP
jgi:hypothetical protein